MFIDRLLTDVFIEKEMKMALKRSIAIEASNVSDYYWQSGKQMWDFQKDFPNIAPPFEDFFLDFQAPKQWCNSQGEMVPWSKKTRPFVWGVLCRSLPLLNFRTEEERSFALETITQDVASLEDIGMFLEEQRKFFQDTHQWLDSLSSMAARLYYSYRSKRNLLQMIQKQEWGKLIEFTEKEQSNARWRLNMCLFQKYSFDQAHQVMNPMFSWDFLVDSSGHILTCRMPGGFPLDIYVCVNQQIKENIIQALQSDYSLGMRVCDVFFQGCLDPYHTALLAISFMHCKNVVLRQQTPPAVQQTAKQKRQRIQPHQPVTYHVLDIEPMKTILKTEGKSEQVGLQRALHICRGHFSTYTEDKKLFGKYAGTFWIPQHVRGSAEVGFATKDYRIKLEK